MFFPVVGAQYYTPQSTLSTHTVIVEWHIPNTFPMAVHYTLCVFLVSFPIPFATFTRVAYLVVDGFSVQRQQQQKQREHTNTHKKCKTFSEQKVWVRDSVLCFRTLFGFPIQQGRRVSFLFARCALSLSLLLGFSLQLAQTCCKLANTVPTPCMTTTVWSCWTAAVRGWRTVAELFRLYNLRYNIRVVYTIHFSFWPFFCVSHSTNIDKVQAHEWWSSVGWSVGRSVC